MEACNKEPMTVLMTSWELWSTNEHHEDMNDQPRHFFSQLVKAQGGASE